MTTTFMNTKGLPLYRVNGETYCKMIDVIRLIHHEYFETDDKNLQRILDRMEMRVAKNDFLLKDATKPQVISEDKKYGRYAVGYYDENGAWHFYKETVDGKDIYSTKPCEAKLFYTFRDASACADFIDTQADVLDFETNMTEEQRWQRELTLPYDADEGNETSIPVEIVT